MTDFIKDTSSVWIAANKDAVVIKDSGGGMVKLSYKEWNFIQDCFSNFATKERTFNVNSH